MRIGILDDGDLICLDTVEGIKRKYHSGTLEQAFFAATGHGLEDVKEDE